MQYSNILLYGPPGSGKSAAGTLLAKKLSLPFYDLDEEVQKRCGKSITEIFSQAGEHGFRELELAELGTLLGQGKSMVVALGGGSLLSPAARRLAEANSTVVCLEADLAGLLRRLESASSRDAAPQERPLLRGDLPARLSSLLVQRRDHYASFTQRLDTTGLDPQQVVWQLQVQLGRYRVAVGHSTQEILVQPGGTDALGEMLAARDLIPPVALVTDSHLAPLYVKRVLDSLRNHGISAQLAVIPAGEASKNIDRLQELWGNFLEAGLERGSEVIALGGGVVGDLAGFAASTYLRGIRWISLPTSLLAMVDASLGGKTGIDTSYGKNLAGAFHPARLVLVDPQLLSSLPEIEMRCGLAEIVKHGIIGDPELLNLCAGFFSCWRSVLPPGRRTSWDSGQISQFISRAMAVKIRIIEQDPFEKGLRAALNLGHTIGHALEVASAYHLRHGEAVSVGMVVEARLAERLGLAEAGLSQTIAGILAELRLPVEIPEELERAVIRQAIQVDKKKRAGRVHFALPVRLGHVQTGVEVPDSILTEEV